MRTKINYKNKNWKVQSKLECNELNMERLDFTCGSGSTLEACKNLNRRSIGIEMDDDYFEIAKKRIEYTEVEKGLFDDK